MDIFLLIAGFVLVFGGIIGSVLPVLPGPLTGWFGLLLLHLTDVVPMNYTVLIITFVIALAVFVLDYIIPSMGAKKYGGSKKGAFGAAIGLLIGLISPIPLGFIVGAFLGAFIGELINDHQDIEKAVKSAYGSFMGFLASTGLKLMVSFCFVFIYVFILYDHWQEIKTLSSWT